MAILDLWNKGSDATTFFYDVTYKILSRDSNYTLDFVMWPKFGNSSNSIKEVIITSVLYKDLTRKKHFL